MPTILEQLAGDPQADLEFDQDTQIREMIMELGLADQLQQDPGQMSATIQMLQYNEHATHRILILLMLGFSKPTDNGYLAWCVPKHEYSQPIFTELCRQLLRHVGGRLPEARLFNRSQAPAAN